PLDVVPVVSFTVAATTAVYTLSLHDALPILAIIGCYAQLKPAEIAEIPGVDAVLGAAEKFRLVELLDGFQRTPAPRVLASPVERDRKSTRLNSSHVKSSYAVLCVTTTTSSAR